MYLCIFIFVDKSIYSKSFFIKSLFNLSFLMTPEQNFWSYHYLQFRKLDVSILCINSVRNSKGTIKSQFCYLSFTICHLMNCEKFCEKKKNCESRRINLGIHPICNMWKRWPVSSRHFLPIFVT